MYIELNITLKKKSLLSCRKNRDGIYQRLTHWRYIQYNILNVFKVSHVAVTDAIKIWRGC